MKFTCDYSIVDWLSNCWGVPYMLILDHGNSLVYSSIPVLGSCPGLIYLETTCTRGHFLFRCSLSSNDGKRRFHASNTPFSFPWMVFHSFLVIIPIVWVNKRDYLPIFSFQDKPNVIGVCHQLSFFLSHLRNSHGAEFQDQLNSANLIWVILRIYPKSIRISFIPNLFLWIT